MNNPLHTIDTAPIESAVETALDVVGDRLADVTTALADVTETVGERVVSDVVPVAKRSAERTQEIVQQRPRVSWAAIAGAAAVVALVVWLVKRGGDDDDES